MNLKELAEDFSVSAQIKAGDIAQLASLGFKAIICNRPDGEGLWQPDFASISKAAEQAGLKASYLPVSPGNFGPADGAAFGEILEALPKPVLAYCATGNRSSALWALSKPK